MKINFFTALLCGMITMTPLYATELAPPPPLKTTPSSVQPLININTADVHTLTGSMKGIGAKRAQAIVQYREKNDKFKSLDDIALVPGLGKSFVKSHFELLQKTFILK